MSVFGTLLSGVRMKCKFCGHDLKKYTDVNNEYGNIKIKYSWCDNCEMAIRTWRSSKVKEATADNTVQFLKDTLTMEEYKLSMSHDMNLIKQYCPGITKALDIGCCCGAEMLLLEEMGVKTVGYDISSLAIKECKKLGLEVYSNLRDCGDGFDFIVCREVIEHLKNPWDLLDIAKKKLVKGGKIYIQTPDPKAALDLGPKDDLFELCFQVAHKYCLPRVTVAKKFEDNGFKLLYMNESSNVCGVVILEKL